MSDNAKFFTKNVYQFSDYPISQNTFSVRTMTVLNDEYSELPPFKIQLSVTQYRPFNISTINLSFNDLFVFINRFRERYNDTRLSDINRNFANTDIPRPTETWNFECMKKVIIIQFCYRVEYSGCAIMIAISDKKEHFLDVEKCYMNFDAFLSFLSIIGQIRNNFAMMNDNNLMIIMLQRIFNRDQSSEKIEALLSSINKNISQSKEMNKTKDVELFPLQKTDSSISTHILTDSDIETVPDLNSELSGFMQETMKTVVLPLDSMNMSGEPTKSDKIVNKTIVKLVEPSIMKFLNNDILNFEMIVTNICNSSDPFESFIKFINSETECNLIENISEIDVNKMRLFVNFQMKSKINNLISKKQKLPSTILPAVFSISDFDNKRMNLLCEFFIILIYYTQVRNILQDKDRSVTNNRELFNFQTKLLLSPFIFSYFPKIQKDVLIGQIKNKYNEMASGTMFTNIKEEIRKRYNLDMTVSQQVFETEVNRIFDSLTVHWDKLQLNTVVDSLGLKIKSSHFSDYKMTSETITSIIQIEMATGYDILKTPAYIQALYSVQTENIVSADNSNLIRYFKEKVSDLQYQSKCLDLIKNIRNNYNDLKSINFDYANMDECCLKALILWDPVLDPTISKNYMYFCDLIEKSSLTKDTIFPMLLLEKKSSEPVDVYDSFRVSHEESFDRGGVKC